MSTVYTEVESPIVGLVLARNEAGISHICFREGKRPFRPLEAWRRDDGAFSDVVGQLASYFEGKLKDFELPLAPEGTDFQHSVWAALRTIPYGKTVSYRDIAEEVGRPDACRAVGAANGRNPIAIVVPCHRVVGSNGRLTGYAGGVELKEKLLRLENTGCGVSEIGQMSLV